MSDTPFPPDSMMRSTFAGSGHGREYRRTWPGATTPGKAAAAPPGPGESARHPPEAQMPLDTQPGIPRDFGYETEHPVLPVPFTMRLDGHAFEGKGLSVTAAYVAIDGPMDPAAQGRRQVVTLRFDFQGFSVTLSSETIVAPARQDGEMILQFVDPSGPHLPQLRYILNAWLAGDAVSMNGMLAYTGPTRPKSPKPPQADDKRRRVRSIAVAIMSASLILMAGTLLYNRLTQSFEPRPVFIERAGNVMKATTAGQVSYLDPDAGKGEVAFAINANSGDVLNFPLPCDCEFTVAQGVFEGATVLPVDPILTVFESGASVRVETRMSVEGLSKVMSGERATLDLNDGRSVPVRVVLTSASNVSTHRGDDFVPVRLVPREGALRRDDIGKVARLRLSKSWFGGEAINASEAS